MEAKDRGPQSQAPLAPAAEAAAAAAPQPPAWLKLSGVKRVAAEFKSVSEQIARGALPQLSDLTTVNDDMLRWRFHVSNFDEDHPAGKQLNRDLEKWAGSTPGGGGGTGPGFLTRLFGGSGGSGGGSSGGGGGSSSSQTPAALVMEAKFPAAYPAQPFFLRLVRPRCRMYTGHVTAGGSICIEALTLSGSSGSWRSDFCFESIIQLVLINMLHAEVIYVQTATGPGGTAGPLRVDFSASRSDYTEAEAKSAFSRMMSHHGANGWGNDFGPTSTTNLSASVLAPPPPARSLYVSSTDAAGPTTSGGQSGSGSGSGFGAAGPGFGAAAAGAGEGVGAGTGKAAAEVVDLSGEDVMEMDAQEERGGAGEGEDRNNGNEDSAVVFAGWAVECEEGEEEDEDEDMEVEGGGGGKAAGTGKAAGGGGGGGGAEGGGGKGAARAQEQLEALVEGCMEYVLQRGYACMVEGTARDDGAAITFTFHDLPSDVVDMFHLLEPGHEAPPRAAPKPGQAPGQMQEGEVRGDSIRVTLRVTGALDVLKQASSDSVTTEDFSGTIPRMFVAAPCLLSTAVRSRLEDGEKLVLRDICLRDALASAPVYESCTMHHIKALLSLMEIDLLATWPGLSREERLGRLAACVGATKDGASTGAFKAAASLAVDARAAAEEALALCEKEVCVVKHARLRKNYLCQFLEACAYNIANLAQRCFLCGSRHACPASAPTPCEKALCRYTYMARPMMELLPHIHARPEVVELLLLLAKNAATSARNASIMTPTLPEYRQSDKEGAPDFTAISAGLEQLPAVGEMARCRCHGELMRMLNREVLTTEEAEWHRWAEETEEERAAKRRQQEAVAGAAPRPEAKWTGRMWGAPQSAARALLLLDLVPKHMRDKLQGGDKLAQLPSTSPPPTTTAPRAGCWRYA